MNSIAPMYSSPVGDGQSARRAAPAAAATHAAAAAAARPGGAWTGDARLVGGRWVTQSERVHITRCTDPRAGHYQGGAKVAAASTEEEGGWTRFAREHVVTRRARRSKRFFEVGRI